MELNKQETLEEAAHEHFKKGQLGFEKAADTEHAFLKGAKWMQERMYSEEEVLKILRKREDYLGTVSTIIDYLSNEEWFKQFKKI